MASAQYKVNLPLITAFLLFLIFNLEPSYAQWPPFRFNLMPSYEAGKITYNITFSNRSETDMTDVTITIPLPAGARFLEATAQPNSQVTFNGKEVTFFTAVLHEPIRNASFVVETTDPAQTIFTTHAWIAWKGNPPGDYLTDDQSFDITRPPLNWDPPLISRLQLEMSATSVDNLITYNLYPSNVGEFRMWDVKINVPVPEGTTFLSADAPPPFATSFDGREISFFIVELSRNDQIPQLSFKVSVNETLPIFISTHAWATWKNKGWAVGRTMPSSEQIITGDIVIQPNITQQVVADTTGDVPFADYDITSLALLADNTTLTVVFYTVGESASIDNPLEYILYIDNDCNNETGYHRNELGAEYRLVYRPYLNKAEMIVWDADQQNWGNSSLITVSQPSPKAVFLMVPLEWLQDKERFCWIGITRNVTDKYSSSPPIDQIPDDYIPRLVQYKALAGTKPYGEQITNSYNLAEVTSTVSPTVAVSSSLHDIKGKLAVPLDNGQVLYNVHIFAMPDGKEIVKIPNTRQPNFRFDGQRLLLNHEGGGRENIFEYNMSDGTEKQVSDAPRDSHPFYDAWGNRVTYGNPEMIFGMDGAQNPFIFMQCGLMPPHLETEARCRDILSLGVLVPAGQMGEIQGTNPVWASNDMIVYKGCNTWAGSRLCGIYSVPAVSTKGLSNGFIPRQLTSNPDDIPSDTKGSLIAFSSNRDGNWEAYGMDLNGAGVINFSNSPASNDGLPTISPDGQWVAFVSDRGGQWAVWAVLAVGGLAQKLFDLPETPWGDGDRAWINERISWGP